MSLHLLFVFLSPRFLFSSFPSFLAKYTGWDLVALPRSIASPIILLFRVGPCTAAPTPLPSPFATIIHRRPIARAPTAYIPQSWRKFVALQAITLATKIRSAVPAAQLQPTTRAPWTPSVNIQARLRIGWTLSRTLSSRKWLLVHVCLFVSNFTESLAYL